MELMMDHGLGFQDEAAPWVVERIGNCFAGREAHERPIRSYLDDHEYLVEDILDQWYGPADTVFKVRASAAHAYILRD